MTEPANGRLNAFHEAVVAHLAAELGAGYTVEEGFGPFNVDELAAYGARAPAVKVAITGPGSLEWYSDGTQRATLTVFAYVVTRNAPAMPAHKAAQALAERVATRLHKQTYGLVYVEPPQGVEIDNLYSGKLREKAGANIALFAVSWQQAVYVTATTVEVPPPPTDPLPEFDIAVDGLDAGDASPLASQSQTP